MYEEIEIMMSGLGVRIFLVFAAMLLGACEGSFFQVGDIGRKTRIDKAYGARDSCLARNAAADGAKNEDAATLAHAIAMACAPETEKLVVESAVDGDAKVAAAIRRDSDFRAMGFVLKARGQPIF